MNRAPLDDDLPPVSAWTGMGWGLGLSAVIWLVIYATVWTLMHVYEWPDIFEPLRMLGL